MGFILINSDFDVDNKMPAFADVPGVAGFAPKSL